jgi:hypothetical protein
MSDPNSSRRVLPLHVTSDHCAAFLRADKNTMFREAIYRERLLFDLKVAAARAGYYLRSYVADVDNHGFDIVLDGGMEKRPFQIKTVLATSSTRRWSVRASILKPSLRDMDSCGALWSTTRIGLGGGIVVCTIDPTKPEGPVAYAYCDLDLISLVHVKWLTWGVTRSKATRLLGTLLHEAFDASITLGQDILVPAKDAESLLALAGMRTRRQTSWRGLFRDAFGHRRDGRIEQICYELNELTTAKVVPFRE